MNDPAADHQPIVLYVDDEEQSLKYFARLLGKHYRVLTAPSAARARELIGGEEVAVIISDQRMPGETGVDLLSWARREYPLATRMLTTAYSDLESAIAAVNSGAVFQYIVKPWDLNDLRMATKRAVDFHTIARDRDRLLREKLVSLQRLVILDRVRSFAVVAATLSHRLRNPLLALKTFLEAVPDEQAEAGTGGDEWGDLWDLARSESRRMLDLVEDVIDHVVRPEFGYEDSVDVAARIAEIVAEHHLGARVSGSAGSIRCDRSRFDELVAVCSQRLRAARPEADLDIETSEGRPLHGQESVNIVFRLSGGPLEARERKPLFDAMFPRQDATSGQASADLLAAYFIVFHHGGTLALNLGEDRPGLVACLPRDPTAVPDSTLDSDWLDRVFTLFEP